jgi:glutamate dehydrogenase/leucine dehydrogenase
MVRSRGGIQHLEWSGRFDGRDYPVQGVGYVLTNAYRQLSDRSYEIVVKVDDRAAAVATAVVSSDGRTLDVETQERDAKGRTVTTTAKYQRQ